MKIINRLTQSPKRVAILFVSNSKEIAMKSSWQICKPACAALLLTFAASAPALAQYVWINENGVKQYSDMAPPASVPASRILKAPGNTAPKPASEPTAPPAGATAPAAKKNEPLTYAEQNADFQKRRMEQAEKEKKAEEEASKKAERAKNCERARSYQRALEDGQRIARTDKNGERVILDDKERAQEMQAAKKSLDQCSS